MSLETVVPSGQLLRHHQREDMKQEIQNMETMLPNLKSTDDRGQVVSRLKRMKKGLIEQSPADLDGSTANKVNQEIKTLEEKITQGMLSKEEMRKNPAGAVGQFMKWERANKKAIMRWKNLQILRDPTSDDPDLANIERLRPNGAIDRFRSDAQITGKMSYGNISQEAWDTAFQGKGPENTALKQAQKVEHEQPKSQMSDEARERARQRMLEFHRKKKLAEADVSAPIQEGEPVTLPEA